MSEESVLILNMLREGKVTAEQADSLLRAVRETQSAPAQPAPPPPPAAPTPPAPPDSAAMAAMQAKLSDLQGKLGDLQGKLGAAQTSKTADYASALAGKLLDTLPKPEIDMSKINKAVDEAMRGLSSLKNDAVKTAKTAARQAQQEARRAGREGRRGFKFSFDFGGDSTAGRPQNTDNAAQAAQTSQDTLTWTGADILALGKPLRQRDDFRRGPAGRNRRSVGDENRLGGNRSRSASAAPAGIFDQSNRKRPLQSRRRRTPATAPSG